MEFNDSVSGHYYVRVNIDDLSIGMLEEKIKQIRSFFELGKKVE